MGRLLKGTIIVVAMFLVGAGVALAGQELGQLDRDHDRVSTPDNANLGDGDGVQKQVRANAAIWTAAAEELTADQATDENGADDPQQTRECNENAERVGAEDCEGDRERTQTRTRDRDGDCDGEEPQQTQTRTRDRDGDCDGSGSKAQTQTQAGTQSQTSTQTQAGTQSQAGNGGQNTGNGAGDGSGPADGGNGDCDGSGKGRSTD